MDPSIRSSIRVAFVIEGSRGDIQPYLAIALRLKERGNIVRVFTNSDQASLCESFDVPVDGVFYSFSEALGRPAFREALAKGDAFQLGKRLRELRMTNLPNDLINLWPALDSFGPTVLLSGGIAKSKTMLYSNTKMIPLVVVDLQVLLPVSDKGPAGLPTLPFGLNKLWWKLLLAGAKSHIRSMKAVAKESLSDYNIQVDGTFEIPMMHAMMTEIPNFPGPFCVGTSTHVIPVHPEWPTENFYPCGFFIIHKKEQEILSKDPVKGSQFGAGTHTLLEEFLEEGPPPVYLGWGSMVCKSPGWMATLALEALQKAKARGILLGGWAGISKDHIPEHLVEFCDTNVIFVPSCPHEWLFPRCACIVHHGGSGTTAASVRSGKPTIITPIQGDQFDFADGIQTIGCGAGLPHLSAVTSTLLGDTISECLTNPDILDTAKETGAKLRAEDGCEKFCTVFDEWLVRDFVSGKWLTKQTTLLQRCEDSWKTEQKSMCTIS